jgi:hypothetical protein
MASANLSNPYSAVRAQGSNRQPTRSNTMALTSKPHRSTRTANTASPATLAAKRRRSKAHSVYPCRSDSGLPGRGRPVDHQGKANHQRTEIKSYWIRGSFRLGFIELKVVMNDFMFRVSLLFHRRWHLNIN